MNLQQTLAQLVTAAAVSVGENSIARRPVGTAPTSARLIVVAAGAVVLETVLPVVERKFGAV